MKLAPSAARQTLEMTRLTRRLGEAEATIAALLAGQVDAVVDPRSQTPVLLSLAQDALRESEERYRTIVETTNEGIWTVDRDSRITFVNQRLATLFGLTAPGATTTTFAATMWPATQARIGMLSQPAFLWAISDPTTTSIVHRGKFIHDNIVCQDGLPPPIDLTSPTAQAVIAMGNSEITHSDARLMPGAVCSVCHGQMDPYARVLQNYDPVGNYRTMDEVGAAINPSVTFPASSGGLSPSPLAGMTVNWPLTKMNE